MPSIFGGIWDIVKDVGAYVGGLLGRGAREELTFPEMQEALEVGGLGPIPDFFEPEYEQHLMQASVLDHIMGLTPDYLIPQHLHVSTERLLPDKYMYEVNVTTYDEAGEETVHPYYVGSDRRLSQEEILETADSEAEESPVEGAIGYSVGELAGSWMRRSG